MKDFNIAKYLKENHLGSHAILGAYVDLHNLKEEEEVELDTEIPYEGPEHKLDGFGDEFVQDSPVEEAGKEDKGISDDRFAAAGGDSIKFAIKSLMDIGVDGKKIAQFVVDTIRAFQK